MRNHLRPLRQKKKIAASRLARRAGVSTSFITLIELGYKNPARELAERISAVLKVPVWLVFPELARQPKEELHVGEDAEAHGA